MTQLILEGLFAIDGQSVSPESLEVIMEHNLPEPTVAKAI